MNLRPTLLLLPPVLLLLAATAAAITPDQVMTAAAVLGLGFLDEEEVELMLPDLEENLAALDSISHTTIRNEVSPALVFSPVLRPEQLPADTSISAPAAPPNLPQWTRHADGLRVDDGRGTSRPDL